MSFKTRIRRLCTGAMETFASVAKAVVNTIANVTEFLGCESATEKLRTQTKELEKTRQKWEDRYEHWNHVSKVESSKGKYHLEKPDIGLRESSTSYLETKFPQGITNTMANQSNSERVDTIQNVVKDVAKIFDVKIDSIDFFEPQNMAQLRTMGFYYREDNSINLNIAYIVSENPRNARDQVLTIFHEMMHARQWAAATRQKDYGYSNERLVEWIYNFYNYIPAYESDEAYRKQPLERDAFGFEAELEKYL